eukprot:763259-Hanusia_phi.AAC.4
MKPGFERAPVHQKNRKTLPKKVGVIYTLTSRRVVWQSYLLVYIVLYIPQDWEGDTRQLQPGEDDEGAQERNPAAQVRKEKEEEKKSDDGDERNAEMRRPIEHTAG